MVLLAGWDVAIAGHDHTSYELTLQILMVVLSSQRSQPSFPDVSSSAL